jgi:hypothetical protein
MIDLVNGMIIIVDITNAKTHRWAAVRERTIAEKLE